MQTPYLPRAIFGGDFQNVYEPAEDTFLLLDALENDLDALKQEANICLECGSGSGTVITALSIALKEDDGTKCGKNRLMFATDINPEACRTTKKCVKYHGQTSNIDVIRTNLAESLVDRLEHSVDVLLFNPPYVPTEDHEHLDSAKHLQHSWAGGAGGRKLIDTFLTDYVPRLLSKPSGVAYMVAVAENNVPDLHDYLLRSHNISGKVVQRRQAGRELLHVIKYQWNN